MGVSRSSLHGHHDQPVRRACVAPSPRQSPGASAVQLQVAGCVADLGSVVWLATEFSAVLGRPAPDSGFAESRVAAELGDVVLLVDDFLGDFEFELGGEVATGLWHVRCSWGGGIVPPIGLFEKIRPLHTQPTSGSASGSTIMSDWSRSRS